MASATGKNKTKTAPKDGKVTEPPETKTETKADAKETKTKELVTIKAAALSVDVGPRVIAGLANVFKQEDEANKLMSEATRKRYDLLADTTGAIIKAVKADDSIDLSAAVSGDIKQMNKLNDQLGLALGFREIVVIPGKKGEEGTKTIQTAKSVAKYFPSKADTKGSPEAARKATLRTNFLHTLKKCAQAALGMIEKDIVVKPDKDTGTLRISGPAVMERFGQSEVILNEKLTVGEGDNKVVLKAKPSFTELAKMGAESKGQVIVPRKDSRAAGTAVSIQTAVQSICATLLEQLGKMKEKPNPETIKQLNAVKSGVDKMLADNK